MSVPRFMKKDGRICPKAVRILVHDLKTDEGELDYVFEKRKAKI